MSGGAVLDSGEQNHVMRGVACALSGGICWGFSGMCAQILMDYHISAIWITCMRMLISSAFFLAFSILRDWRELVAVIRDWRSLVQIIIFSIFGVACTQITYLFSIEYTSAGVATTLQQIGLAFIMIYVCLRDRRLPRMRELLGLVCALTGTFIIATQGDISHLGISPQGLMWSLLAAVTVALYTLLPERVLQKWGSLQVSGLSMLIGGGVASALFHPLSIPVQLSGNALLAFVGIVVVGTVAAYMLYLQGVNDAGPVRASLLCCAEPVSATLLTMFLLHTPVSLWDMIGCVFIIIMVFLIADRTDRERSDMYIKVSD